MEAGIYWPSVFFLLFGGLACAFALAVVFSSNIVHMAFYLVLSLGATAGLFFLAGAEFVGAMQLLIYVGGTLVLLVFGVMLTAQGPFISMKTRDQDWIWAAVFGSALLAVLIITTSGVESWRGSANDRPQLSATPTATRIGLGLLGTRVDRMEQEDGHADQGMSGYLLPFEIISVHLLVVLIGAAYLARARRRREE